MNLLGKSGYNDEKARKIIKMCYRNWFEGVSNRFAMIFQKKKSHKRNVQSGSGNGNEMWRVEVIIQKF